MDVKQLIAGRYARAQAQYDAVPEDIREDLFGAITWARETLRDHEGSGHNFEISYDERKQGFVASFSKPQWNADHASQPMNTAQNAIVMAVCEYLCGV